jgi:hypothetical protein
LIKHQGQIDRKAPAKWVSEKAKTFCAHQKVLELGLEVLSGTEFRQVIQPEQMGEFLVESTHRNGLIVSLKVFPIRNGKVGAALTYNKASLPDLANKIQKNLTILFKLHSNRNIAVSSQNESLGPPDKPAS